MDYADRNAALADVILINTAAHKNMAAYAREASVGFQPPASQQQQQKVTEVAEAAAAASKHTPEDPTDSASDSVHGNGAKHHTRKHHSVAGKRVSIACEPEHRKRAMVDPAPPPPAAPAQEQPPAPEIDPDMMQDGGLLAPVVFRRDNVEERVFLALKSPEARRIHVLFFARSLFFNNHEPIVLYECTLNYAQQDTYETIVKPGKFVISWHSPDAPNRVLFRVVDPASSLLNGLQTQIPLAYFDKVVKK